MKLLMCMAHHSDTDGLSLYSNKMVLYCFCGVATDNQPNSDDILQSAGYTYNTAGHCVKKQMSSELDLSYELSLQLDVIAQP
jgi:hypothetical protein